MAKEKVPGFSKAQRMWILERDGHRCSFMTYGATEKKWARCKNTTHLQVHHITARGFYYQHLRGCGWDVNSPENGITLCSFHHVGDGAQNEHKPYIIHWDVKLARRAYRGKGSSSFEKMKARRMELNEKYGRPYWNTRWDWLFALVVATRNKKFHKHFPANKDRSYTTSNEKGTLFTID